jgi:chemotaxis protein methyltransferase CheR
MTLPYKLTKHLDAEATHLSAADYRVFQFFLSESCGIELNDDKQYLVKSRLLSLLGKHDVNSLAELAILLQSNSTLGAKVKSAVIDAMTTNETFWFRDEKQFSLLQNTLLPDLFARKTGALKIWSAACSSGQEPYSLSIVVLEALQAIHKTKTVQIIGTDISETILDEAKKAEYSELALSRGIDAQTKARYFEKNYAGYNLKAEVSNQVRFQQFNLLKPFAALGRFDIIFCRNVLIYFSNAVKRDIINRMADNLEPSGYLFLSSTESMPNGITSFKTVHAGNTCYYQKTG